MNASKRKLGVLGLKHLIKKRIDATFKVIDQINSCS